MFPLFGSATICRSFSCIRWSSQSLQTIFGMNGMRIVLNLQLLEKNYSRNLWIHIPLFYWCWIHINHHSIHWPPKCTTYTHNCTGSRLTWTFFATNYHEFAIFGCGYLRETKTFTLHLTTKTTPIIPNLPPKLCKFQAKDPGTPIERGIFDASQIATHLVDDAIATPWRMDGSDDNTGRTNGMFFFFKGCCWKKQRIIHDYPDCCKMST